MNDERRRLPSWWPTEPTTFYPSQVIRELIVAIIVLVGVVETMAILLPVTLETKANPLQTPVTIAPEWYFLWLFQLLKLIPEILAVALVGVLILAIFALPFLDRNPERRPTRRPVVTALGAGLVILITILTLWAALSAG